MENVIKAFLGIFFTFLCVFLGVLLITTSIDTRKADSYLEDASTRIESSNFSSSVVADVKKEASNNEYEVDVNVSGIPPYQHGYITLKYKTTLPIINYTSERTITSDLN
ncbi:MAG: hypothetical protein E7279_01560 [Lachnospiraceae bacterium]|nr:hypothetical protein [Lachnospiraceae bacterium]